ncbi:MAG TPA: DUF4251 domain-containing protein [Chitinophagaceae bacterium]|nr:DUF4251 domain-containing protein [Chitinophagaceae bacterium]
MRIYTTRIFYVASLLITLCSLPTKFTFGQLTGNDLDNAIASKNFAFTVLHESGGDYALGNYYFHIVNDSLSVALPYSGKSGTAAYTIDDNGINIHTKDFTYQSTSGKKGGYTIKILLSNDRNTRSFSLRINKKGFATLTADCMNREAPVFSGAIQNL